MKGEGRVAEESGERLEGEPETAPPRDRGGDQDEFKITIRKLELPVRPRGVLAE